MPVSEVNERENLRLLAESGLVRGGLFCVEVDAPSLGFFAHLGGVMSMLRLCDRLSLKPLIRLASSNYLEPARGPCFLDYFFEGPALSAEEERLLHSAPLTRIGSFFDLPGLSPGRLSSVGIQPCVLEQILFTAT